MRDELPTSVLAVHVPRGDTLTPLVTKTMQPGADITLAEDLAVEAWAVGAPVVDDRVFAFPLATSAGSVSFIETPVAFTVIVVRQASWRSPRATLA